MSSTFLGVALTALVFLTLIGFALRRTNIIESSALALFIAYNVWICGLDQSEPTFLAAASSYLPLIGNLKPHFEALVNFVTNTLPKPVLIALLYRLTILHVASRILPTIGADSWESESGVDHGWEDRPVRTCYLNYSLILTTVFLDVYVDSYTVNIPTTFVCDCILPPPFARPFLSSVVEMDQYLLHPYYVGTRVDSQCGQ
jgi:hypothetical protein